MLLITPVLWLLFSVCTQAQTPTMCYFEGGRTILVRDRLYWMGGTYSFLSTHDVTRERSLYWIDLKNNTFPVENLITSDTLHNTSISSTQYEGGGAFWTDVNQTNLYSMAGFRDNADQGSSNIATYLPETNNWRTVAVDGGSFNKLNRVNAMYASSYDGGGNKSWMAGGVNLVPGMVTFDTTDPMRPTWTNRTEDIPYFWGATTQYVRFGTQGVLVSVGGYTSHDLGGTAREMSSVQVYDIESGTWDVVYATGDVPKPRSEFCSALSAAPDDSSFQMTIYGGWSQADNYSLADVYVLTMPAFHWVKINDTGNNETDLAEHSGRRRHYCHAYNDRSMIVLGGAVLDGGAAFNITSCNKSYPPIKLLDTTTFEWKSQYPLPNTTYQVPQPVIDVIGGGPNGGARPASAFPSASAIAAFATTVAKYDPQNPRSLALSDKGGDANVDPGTSNGEPSSSSTNTGAIAGGVVGALVGLALIGVLIFFFLRKRRRNQSKDQEWEKSELSSEAPPPAWAPSRPDFGTHEFPANVDGSKWKPVEMDGGQGVRKEMDGFSPVEAPASDRGTQMGEPPAVGSRRR